MSELTKEKLDKYESDVAGNERVGLTASRVDNADLLSLIAAARELEGLLRRQEGCSGQKHS